MAKLELYGSTQCPHTRELREWLEWTRREFEEYDVDADPEARARMRTLDGGSRTVPEPTARPVGRYWSPRKVQPSTLRSAGSIIQ